MQNKQSQDLSFASLSTSELANVNGGQNQKDPIVSPETVGCAVGGALGAPLGPAGGAAGCIAGAALTNSINSLPEDKAAALVKSGAFAPAK